MKLNSIIYGKSQDKLKEISDNYFDGIITDPPYELGFMGKSWDVSGIAYNVELWKEVLRVAKPGSHLLCFGGTRTHHRVACAIEDAGWILRDEIDWIYGEGFPKSCNISKQLDKEAGVERIAKPIINTVTGKPHAVNCETKGWKNTSKKYQDFPEAITNDAKRWDGYGTALKPAHEPIIVAMKPLDGTFAQNAKK
jgi:site-specific DNA-methyltransferase (adenine-specific)